MNSSQLRTFIMIVELGSLSQAAKVMGVTKAAISQKLTQLEMQLAVKLIKRSTRQLTLTEAGELLYKGSKPLLETWNELVNEVSNQVNKPEGAITIMMSRYFANRFIQPHLSKFTEQYPDIQLTLYIEERFPNFKTELIDILIGTSLDGPPELKRRKLLTTRYTLCASPAYLDNHPAIKRPQDLIQHRYITHSMRSPNNVIHFDQNQTVIVQPALYVNDVEFMLERALTGEGIVMLHHYIAKQAIEENKLVEILKPYNLGAFPVYVYFKNENFLPLKTRVFLEFLYDTLAYQL